MSFYNQLYVLVSHYNKIKYQISIYPSQVLRDKGPSQESDVESTQV